MKRDTIIEEFTKELKSGIEHTLNQEFRGKCNVVSKPTTQRGFALNVIYERIIEPARLMVHRSSQKEELVVVDRFERIELLDPRVRKYSPVDLRNAARMYESVDEYLRGSFGDPVFEHEGTLIYQTDPTIFTKAAS